MVSMVEVMKLDIHACEQDVLTATLAKLQEQEAKTAEEKVDRADASISCSWIGRSRAAGDARSPGQRASRRIAHQRLARGEPSPAGGSASHPRAGDPRCRGRNAQRRTAASVAARSAGDEGQ